MSLAKYLLIANAGDDPTLELHQIGRLFTHLLARIDWRRDVHFQTRTTIDTLDYSGSGFNQGSKVVWAAVGPPVRELATQVPSDLRLPVGLDAPAVALPGVLVVRGAAGAKDLGRLCEQVWGPEGGSAPVGFPLVVVVDDSEFTARTLNNFVWVTFTRSDPAKDIDGVGAGIVQKHWGCSGPLIIDARIKPHHAPPLVEDPAVTRKIDALAARGGPLARWL
jgi:4-hydroxy-3-polyprenylbenzoate decarboxylase